MKKLLISIFISTCFSEAIAQSAVSVVNYSRMTKSFDRLVPFGENFQIKGSVPPNVVAVRIETIGLSQNQMRERQYEALFQRESDYSLCQSLELARKNEAIHNVKLAWERTTSGSSESQFVINHPQLYFGRTYIFLVTYFEVATSSTGSQLLIQTKNIIISTLKESVRQLDTGNSSFDPIELEEKIRSTYLDMNICEDQILDRNTLNSNFAELAVLVASDANAIIGQQVESDIRSNSILNYDLYNYDGAANLVMSKLKNPGPNQVLTATSVRPYLQNFDAQNKFMISLDGGVIYVSRFQQFIPTLGFNLKINPVDFNDPFSRNTEWSVIVAMGWSTPDDLDPDYQGVFSGSDKSLVTGLGVRFPKFSRILRFQSGLVWYRQENGNPLILDYSTEASFYTGISLNWDTIDFASKLLKSRSKL